MDSITGAAQDVVLVEPATLEEKYRTVITAEAEVYEGVVVTIPTLPTKTYRD